MKCCIVACRLVIVIRRLEFLCKVRLLSWYVVCLSSCLTECIVTKQLQLRSRGFHCFVFIKFKGQILLWIFCLSAPVISHHILLFLFCCFAWLIYDDDNKCLNFLLDKFDDEILMGFLRLGAQTSVGWFSTSFAALYFEKRKESLGRN